MAAKDTQRDKSTGPGFGAPNTGKSQTQSFPGLKSGQSGPSHGHSRGKDSKTK